MNGAGRGWSNPDLSQKKGSGETKYSNDNQPLKCNLHKTFFFLNYSSLITKLQSFQFSREACFTKHQVQGYIKHRNAICLKKNRSEVMGTSFMVTVL